MVEPAASTAPFSLTNFATPLPAPLQRTWCGFIHTTHDALIVLEACLQGKLHKVLRRPNEDERSNLIISGNVFIYDKTSGISRWTDGIKWGPSRVMGNFLIYRELKDGLPAGRKFAKKRRYCTTNPNPESKAAMSQASGCVISRNSIEDYRLVGSFVNSYGFKLDGLVKKTFAITFNGTSHHIVCYYNVSKVKGGELFRPSFDRKLDFIIPRSDLVNSNKLKLPINDPYEDNPNFDQYFVGTPNAPMQHSSFPQSYTLPETSSLTQFATNLSVQPLICNPQFSTASSLPQFVEPIPQTQITSSPYIPISAKTTSAIETGCNHEESLVKLEHPISHETQYALGGSIFASPEQSTHSTDDYHSQKNLPLRMSSTYVKTAEYPFQAQQLAMFSQEELHPQAQHSQYWTLLGCSLQF